MGSDASFSTSFASNCISIHAPRVGSDQRSYAQNQGTIKISIHAPRVGSDRIRVGPVPGRGISIHAPRVGSDFAPARCANTGRGFQSTLPVWGATCPEYGSGDSCGISIHAPRVGSDGRVCRTACPLEISIHAPRVGSDAGPPAKRGVDETISIHAPRVGSDAININTVISTRRFQSTLPVWGATRGLLTSAGYPTFQSTLPVWGATGTTHS